MKPILNALTADGSIVFAASRLMVNGRMVFRQPEPHAISHHYSNGKEDQ